jgi:beta-mannosidase
MTRAGSIGNTSRERLVHGWQICATPPGRYASPEQFEGAGEWLDIPEPTTAAAALRALGAWSLDQPARRFDAEDWWYRVDFFAPAAASGETLWLGCDGLAGVADVWLNGAHLLQSHNMFLALEHEIGQWVRPGANTLVMRFQALDALLAARRPRPRWRTPMVEHQQLRWFRTTLLGRTPGWSPPAAAVGPWKDVWVERRGPMRLADLRLNATVHGTSGRLDLHLAFDGPASAWPLAVEVELQRGERVHRGPLAPGPTGSFTGSLTVPEVALWWPHTHGEPALYAARLRVTAPGSDEAVLLPLHDQGFRTVEVDTADGGYAVRVNGVPVFCRGACWSPLDVVSLRATPQACADAVAQVREAGMNMLRIPGTLVYEDAAFFDACDAHGVLVWQDFMFANMDYPDDAAFVAGVEAEAAQQLALWQGRASIAVVCGNSEVEQQAAMWGAPRECWQPALFHHTLARRVREALPNVAYWPSSAHGGAFPHQASSGTTSYYGVGAYLRPLDDARRADLRFATECLAFANVPAAATVVRMPGGEALRVHHPAWKARAPRDLGAGWDFEDVRDHYLASLYGVQPMALRSADHERYLALSRAVTGELMGAAYTEWRRPGSRCGGALVLMLRDLWAGAGWGVLDDQGRPKPCFYGLARALQPVALGITDEGGNGLTAHLVNEHAQALTGELQLTLYGPGDSLISRTQRAIEVPARGALSLPLADGMEHFLDLSYAYRFGPPPITLVHAQFVGDDEAVRAEAFFLPAGCGPGAPGNIGLSASFVEGEGGEPALLVSSERFAHTVHIEVDGHVAADNHFHLAPGTRRRIALRGGSVDARGSLKAEVGALNASQPVFVRRGA